MEDPGCKHKAMQSQLSFFKDMFDYHHHFNQKLADQLNGILTSLPQRTVPLFSHSINAHQIWNGRIRKSTNLLAVHEIHTLEQCKKLDRANYLETIDILSECDPDAQIFYKNSKGIEFTNSIQQILFHISNHFSHHRGQIISDIRQSGTAPLITDYIFHKRSQ